MILEEREVFDDDVEGEDSEEEVSEFEDHSLTVTLKKMIRLSISQFQNEDEPQDQAMSSQPQDQAVSSQP